jgi:hypothetical protein
VQVAVVPVRVVQRAVDVVVDVFPVGDGGVPASGTVPLGALDGRAGIGMPAIHLDRVLVHVPLVPAVKVPVVKVVGVVAVADGRVPAPGPVGVLVFSGVRRTDHSSLASAPIVSFPAPPVNPPGAPS